ncbi:hypothetical protein D3C81_1595960 [compost metagenome]
MQIRYVLLTPLPLSCAVVIAAAEVVKVAIFAIYATFAIFATSAYFRQNHHIHHIRHICHIRYIYHGLVPLTLFKIFVHSSISFIHIHSLKHLERSMFYATC